jgi:hypothetical protein
VAMPTVDKYQPPDPNQEMVRLLICHVCKSCQELPDYDGPPELDTLLEYRLAEHKFASGTPHKGILPKVPKKDWAKSTYRDAILNKIAEEVGFDLPGSGVGFGDTFYDLKNNFSQDAMTCWKQHNRTTDCGDWRSKSKRLVPDTKADRKAEGMSTRAKDMPNSWLCDFCPVNSVIQTRVNEKRGLYKKQDWE